ncbi:protein RALF-like 22 [Rhodamnia argentea]|uniref:Protein RALF-like 22 n=1 Tax=Rhodamnia argentea TaxID=178133 RepID=A0A8B8QFI3_9MYRT|nr:protein RALF-like 22 [Rhodamnia argentea]
MDNTSKRFDVFLTLLAILAFLVTISCASDYADLHQASFFMGRSECPGDWIGECRVLGEETESEGESESERRILAMRQYISYGALRRNSVPCSRRGASYYNCRAGAPSNPYSRGCSRITRCRG